ncbi:hypothetical protein JW899_02495 [Candidatus Uhrbacteria bacterium]|nr:hypothetical protein [Candidatus Uhrbacteria bacterium]
MTKPSKYAIVLFLIAFKTLQKKRTTTKKLPKAAREDEMKKVSITFVNLGIIVIVAFALYLTESLWAFLGLLFMLSIRRASHIHTTCPKCGCEFVTTSKDEDNDE